MDFKKILKLLIEDFNKEEINYALMGGFAMGVLGIMRATMDLDFLIGYNHLPRIRKIMKKYNYNCVYESKNVSQYVSDVKIFGEIDYLHAFREISISMLKRSKEMPLFKGEIKIKVLLPEDIIGLKLQALVNNPERENQETADIERIANFYKDRLRWDLIKEYFDLFDKEEEYTRLRKRYGQIN